MSIVQLDDYRAIWRAAILRCRYCKRSISAIVPDVPSFPANGAQCPDCQRNGLRVTHVSNAPRASLREALDSREAEWGFRRVVR